MKFIILLPVIVALSSCTAFKSSAHRTLDHIQEAGVVAREIGLPIFDEKCGKIARKCRDTGDRKCEMLSECHKELDGFAKILKTIQLLFVDGKIALSIADEERVGVLVAEATVLIAKIQKQIQELK